MALKIVRAALCLAPVAAQQAGSVTSEESPPIALQHCTAEGVCETEGASLVLDASWRWVHHKDGYENCFADGSWHPDHCPDEDTCKQNCALEGVDATGYEKNYGVVKEPRESELPEGVKLNFMTEGGNVGSRLYVTDGEEPEKYKMFYLLGKEFSLDVDVSKLSCGMNGAVYFIEMDELGGKGQDYNEAGAKFGTGYCDAQCPNEKFVWDTNKGICCVEMDIWEANKMATAYTPHPCSTVGPTKCEGIDCGYGENGERWKGLCDKDGCDMNAYRMNATMFYGPGPDYELDSTKPMTVVTQFLTDDQGNLSEIKRIYVQDGKVINHAETNIRNVTGHNSITDDFCSAQKTAFSDIDHHKEKGGLKSMGEALKRGMVLSLSIWDDYSTQMRWLDSSFPADADRQSPGVARGPCKGDENHPDHVRAHFPDSYVAYSNIRYGPIGSTFSTSGRRLQSEVHV
eukprot:TRINITY_DN1465_c0_g1_i6.p1 TRINITY_DN1465_c0_g1~~TRINITY_DN1465_c0_g1_i6.p1  ORF type:complete len:457 (-),score=96.83 TRINITY_DN1465_c0_g1_i6:264-1634(-)